MVLLAAPQPPRPFNVSFYRMIFGVNATNSAVIAAQTKGASAKFIITAVIPIPFHVCPRRGGSGRIAANPVRPVRSEGQGRRFRIALLKCSSGRFGSYLEAIKGEVMVELAASQLGLRVVKVAPQSLKKALVCAKDQKWRDRAGEMFNPDGKRANWSKGAAGAVAATYKVAGA